MDDGVIDVVDDIVDDVMDDVGKWRRRMMWWMGDREGEGYYG